MTEAPSAIPQSNVVTRDRIRLAFFLAGLNGFEVITYDIKNIYLNALCREKVLFQGRVEMGENCGKLVAITRALYGLKSSGKSWRSTLTNTSVELGIDVTLGDPDIWRRPERSEDGTEYYELCLVYVNAILLVSHNSDQHCFRSAHSTVKGEESR